MPLAGAFALAALTLAQPAAAQEAPPGVRVRSALDREVDAAVQSALQFLVSQQRPSGGWVVDMHGGEATSATSLALMSFLAAGYVPGDPPYEAVFKRGLDYVLRHQQSDGVVAVNKNRGPMYCHGISTLMLAEIVGMVDDAQAEPCRRALEKAIRLILTAQAVTKDRRHSGGWRYQPGSQDSDLSVTAWQLLALRAAKDVGCDVPAEAIDEAIAYVKLCGQGGRGFGYQPGSGPTPVLSGTGLTALQACGVEEADEIDGAIAVLNQRLPRPSDPYYFYGVYYGSIGLHRYGGDPWDRAKPVLFRDLLKVQDRDGSWKPTNGAEQGAGRVYATSMAVLALTVECGYLPIYQK